MQKEWINIDLNVIGIIKQLTLFLGYMTFGATVYGATIYSCYTELHASSLFISYI